MKIAFGADHAGFEYKNILKEYLRENHYQILDFGTFSDEPVDYPDFAFPAAESVAANIADFAVIICGSGVGMSITANKVGGIRAVNCCSAEMARLSREHNNANVITFGSRLVSIEKAKRMVIEFLEGEFLGDRHMIRVEKIHSITGC